MQSSPLSAWWRKGLLDPDLQSVQNPTKSIVSIIQKKPLGPWLTPCLKSKQCHCQHHTEKATWTLTYILFTTQTIPSSVSCQKDLLSLTYWLFKTQSSPLWASCKQNPLGTWLTYCSQSKQFHYQHHAGKASWTMTYILFRTQSKHCQHGAEKASWILTYILLKTQAILLSTPCRKCFLNPDLPPVQTQNSPLLASHKKALLNPDLHPVWTQTNLFSASCRKAFWTLTYRLF